MARGSRLRGGLVAALLSSGCGTVGNLTADPAPAGGPTRPVRQVYGGVRIDAAIATEAAKSALPPYDKLQVLCPVLLACAVVDLPLSLAADTLTLPYTVAHTVLSARQPNTHVPAGSSLRSAAVAERASE